MTFEENDKGNYFYERNKKILELIDLKYDKKSIEIDVRQFRNSIDSLSGYINLIEIALSQENFNGLENYLWSTYFDLKWFLDFVEKFRNEVSEFKLFRAAKKEIEINPYSEEVFGCSMDKIYNLLQRSRKMDEIDNKMRASFFMNFWDRNS